MDKGIFLIVIIIEVIFLLLCCGIVIYLLVNKNKEEEEFVEQERYVHNDYIDDYKTVSIDKTIEINETLHGQESIVLVSTKNQTRNNFSANTPITVGRAADNKLQISENTVSGHHAVITKSDGNVYIEDLSSTNGTSLNGVAIKSKILLKNNDVIMFGKEEYIIEF